MMKSGVALTVVVLLLTVFATPSRALDDEPSTSVAAHVRNLSFLSGEWKGKGWFYHAGGSKSEVSQETRVTISRDALSIRLKDKRKLINPQFPVRALYLPDGAITFDTDRNGYFFHATSEEVRNYPFRIRWIRPRTLEAIVETPQNMIRYQITVDEHGEWKEVDEFFSNTNWVKFQETVLHRVK